MSNRECTTMSVSLADTSLSPRPHADVSTHQPALTIFDLGKLMRGAIHSQEQFDTISFKSDSDKEKSRAETGNRIAFDRQMAFRDLICTMRAETLEDAVVQTVIALQFADCFHQSENYPERRQEEIKLKRVLASILSVLIEKTGIDIGAVDCDWCMNLALIDMQPGILGGIAQ